MKTVIVLLSLSFLFASCDNSDDVFDTARCDELDIEIQRATFEMNTAKNKKEKERFEAQIKVYEFQKREIGCN